MKCFHFVCQSKKKKRKIQDIWKSEFFSCFTFSLSAFLQRKHFRLYAQEIIRTLLLPARCCHKPMCFWIQAPIEHLWEKSQVKSSDTLVGAEGGVLSTGCVNKSGFKLWLVGRPSTMTFAEHLLLNLHFSEESS